jgi:hypothetical protein
VGLRLHQPFDGRGDSLAVHLAVLVRQSLEQPGAREQRVGVVGICELVERSGAHLTPEHPVRHLCAGGLSAFLAGGFGGLLGFRQRPLADLVQFLRSVLRFALVLPGQRLPLLGLGLVVGLVLLTTLPGRVVLVLVVVVFVGHVASGCRDSPCR